MMKFIYENVSLIWITSVAYFIDLLYAVLYYSRHYFELSNWHDRFGQMDRGKTISYEKPSGDEIMLWKPEKSANECLMEFGTSLRKGFGT